MSEEESIVLIRRARAGDGQAWEELLHRYYPRWQRKFHGQMGGGLRRLYETEDVIQSALTQVLRDIGDLRSEGAFFAWVSTIVRRKIAEKGRQADDRRQWPLDDSADVGKEDSRMAERLSRADEYLKVLDAVLEGFAAYPEQMAVVYLRYFEALDVTDISAVLEKSVRSVQRMLREAMEILSARLEG